MDPRAEDGIALVLALTVLVFFSITTVAAVTMSSSSQTTAATGSSQQNAYALAEAGINSALGTLNGQLDNTGGVVTGGVTPISGTLLPSKTVQYPSLGGSVTYSGSLNFATYVWTITSTGTISTGHVPVSRRLTRTVGVVGLNGGANGNAWSRFYQDATTPCLTIKAETFVTNVGTRGDLCLVGNGTITGSGTNVDVGGNISIIGPDVASTAHSPSAGTGWTSPSSVYADDNAYATNTIATGATGSNQDTTGFVFAIPSASIIRGISVSVKRMASICCTNDKQTISVTGTPTGGTFKLSGTPPGGSATTSASIAYNASAATVQAALVTIYGSGNVTCTGGSFPGTAVVCTFAGSDASQPVTLMSLNSKTSWVGGTSPYVTFTHTTTGSSSDPALKDSTVQLLKAGSPVGSNKATTSIWPTTEAAAAYGSGADLWGTTWTAADLNSGNFGLRLAAKNAAGISDTASVDYVSVTVTYANDANGIGTATTAVNQLNVAGTCTYNAGGSHAPCSSTDHTWATTSATVPLASNTALSAPTVDFNYWWANAMPGPKHFCTNPNPGIQTNFFDDDAALAGTAPNQYSTGTTTGPNKSINANGEMAPAGSSYTCQVWSSPPTGGTLLGELSWNATTHVMHVSGTVFIDGNYRWDEDGEIVHYFGRATIMSSKDDEIDAVVCAGGTGTTAATSCLTNMSNWDPTTNEIVLMSQEDNEYDQGSSGCPPAGTTPPNCYNGHTAAGFQGIMYSTAQCEIHQNFQDSGPVICNTIYIPDESGIDPTYYTYPALGNLTDGQKFAGTANATHFEIDVGNETG